MAKLEIDMQPEEEVRLQNLARERGLALGEYVRQALLDLGRSDSTELSVASEREPIWKKAARIASTIPQEDRSLAPKDGSQNYRKYLNGDEYGTE